MTKDWRSCSSDDLESRGGGVGRLDAPGDASGDAAGDVAGAAAGASMPPPRIRFRLSGLRQRFNLYFKTPTVFILSFTSSVQAQFQVAYPISASPLLSNLDFTFPIQSLFHVSDSSMSFESRGQSSDNLRLYCELCVVKVGQS